MDTHVSKDDAVGRGSHVARVEEGVDAGLVVLRRPHAARLAVLRAQDGSLAVHVLHRLGNLDLASLAARRHLARLSIVYNDSAWSQSATAHSTNLL